jgi:uncharacterized protein (DUF58 family)
MIESHGWSGWWTLLIVLAIVSLFMRFDVLLSFVLLLVLASAAVLLWSRYCLHGVAYRRRLRDERIFYGEETELTIEVTNAKPLPLAWLGLADRFPKGISLITGRLVVSEAVPEKETDAREGIVPFLHDLLALRWYERVQRTYRIRGDQRGAYWFGPATLTSGDLFGFDTRYQHVTQMDRLLVYPRVVPVQELGLPFERPAGEFKATRRVIEDPLRMATVREYVPGDSIRYIHWKNSARLDQLQTKVFDPSAAPTLILFCDLQTDFRPYNYVPEYLELAITSSASLAIHALRARQAVGLYVNGGPSGAGHWTYVPPGRSPGQGTQILDALAPLVGFRMLPLHQLLRRSMPALPYGSTVLAITAYISEDLFVALLRVQDAGHPVVLLTVGDRKPDVPGMFTTYHLGGRDAWHRLETLELA